MISIPTSFKRSLTFTQYNSISSNLTISSLLTFKWYTCYVSTFWGIRARVTDILVASLPYGLLIRISSNPDNTNTKRSVNECKCNKDNRNVNSIAIGVRRSKGKVLRQSASVSSDATDAQ